MAFEQGLDTSIIGNYARFAATNLPQIPSTTEAAKSAEAQMGAMTAAQDFSDSQKISVAMRSVDPSSNTYSDDVVRNAQAAGASGKALLALRQNLNAAQSEKLNQEGKTLDIKEKLGKVADDKLTRLNVELDDFNAHLTPLVQQQDAMMKATGGKLSPDAMASLKTQRDASIGEMVKKLQSDIQAGLVDKQQGEQAIQQLIGVAKTPYDPTSIRKLNDESTMVQAHVKGELENRRLAAQTKAELEKAKDHYSTTQQLMPADADHPAPWYKTVAFDQRTGKFVTEGGIESAPKPAGGGFSGAMNQRFAGRVLGAANETAASFDSVARMGSSGGLFSPNDTLPAGLDHVVGSAVAGGVKNIMTSQQQRRYNSSIAGQEVEIATAQNQGMVPHEEQIKHVHDALTILPTDSEQTAQYRVALGARWVRKALETSMTLMNPEQKAQAEKLLERLNKYPDPDLIDNAKPGDNMFPSEVGQAAGSTGTGRSLASQKGDKSTPKTKAADTLTTITSDEEYDKLPSGPFIDPEGNQRIKP